MEGDIDHAEYDENGKYLGKGTEHRMVDTGRPSRKLLGNVSFSSSNGDESNQNLNALEHDEQAHPPQESKGRGPDKSWHLFPRKHHQQQKSQHKGNKKHSSG